LGFFPDTACFGAAAGLDAAVCFGAAACFGGTACFGAAPCFGSVAGFVGAVCFGGAVCFETFAVLCTGFSFVEGFAGAGVVAAPPGFSLADVFP